MRFRWVWIFTAIIVLMPTRPRRRFLQRKNDSRHRRRQRRRRFRYLHARHGTPYGKAYSRQSRHVVENMTGAGTLIAAKYLHSSAKPDGLSFGIFNGALILSGALGNKSIDFEMRELEFLGVPVQDSTVCALRKESGVSNMDHGRRKSGRSSRRPESATAPAT